jgi:hypothetical protein
LPRLKSYTFQMSLVGILCWPHLTLVNLGKQKFIWRLFFQNYF